MILLFRMLVVLAVNGIVIYGVGWKEWNGATALAIYWIETIVGGLLHAASIWFHRRWTRKAGHFRSQLGMTIVSEGNDSEKVSTINSFFAEYLTLIFVFSLGHAVFLAAFLFMILKDQPDPILLRNGALAVVLIQLAGFLADLPTLRTMPFVTLKRIAGLGAGRVLLIQFAIIGGMGLAALTNRPENFLIPFAVLKLLADVASAFVGVPQQKTAAPGCLIGVINFIWPKNDFEQHMAAAAAKRAIEDAADERVMPEKKSTKR